MENEIKDKSAKCKYDNPVLFCLRSASCIVYTWLICVICNMMCVRSIQFFLCMLLIDCFGSIVSILGPHAVAAYNFSFACYFLICCAKLLP